ncbi:MAG: sporulation initiation factor Spo0A C-terminal domain-containing protein [Clostridia bacterium]|nr:sporulation initiation factor Spo0A C-terminal domain-containing protein [Clostridia bacterium]
MCKSALLFSKKDYMLSDALRYICRKQKINLIYAINLPEVLHHTTTSHPEIIFFDAEGFDFNYELYKEFVQSRNFYIPKIIIFSLTPQKYKLQDQNLKVVDKKNFVDEIEKMLSLIEEKDSVPLDKEKIEKCRQKTIEILNEIGITTKYLGYEYIKELVIHIVNDRRMLKSFNTNLYPKIAVKYNTPVNNIERNIRNAINIAKRSCKDKELYKKICGKFNEDTVPSNKQFITWLVEEVS